MQRTTDHDDAKQNKYPGEQSSTGRERRRFERWEPDETTIASISSPGTCWCGRVLNLSEGGAEVLGLPPDAIGCQLIIEIVRENFSVRRTGILKSVRPTSLRDSHAIAFEDFSPFTEIEYTCVCCGMVIELLEGETLKDGEAYMCWECDDRAREQLGRDFDYDELGCAG